MLKMWLKSSYSAFGIRNSSTTVQETFADGASIGPKIGVNKTTARPPITTDTKEMARVFTD